MNEKTFLVADARVTKRTENCVIYNLEGAVLGQFFTGDGIEDIEVIKEKIIVSYFDEGILGMDGPNHQGLVIFDFGGKILFGYNHKHGAQMITDCYCICRHGTNRILCFPYPEFPFIELNVDTFDEMIGQVPEEVKGSASMTSTPDSIIFHSPYKDKGGFFRWKIGAKEVEKIGRFPGKLRGLKNGRFLSMGEKEFTIIEFQDSS